MGFHPLMCFLKSSILSMFLILFGTAFYIRLPLKQSACVPYLVVLVSGTGLTYVFQLITYVCYFHEHSTSYLLIVDLRNSHLPFNILGEEYVCAFYLFDYLKFYYRSFICSESREIFSLVSYKTNWDMFQRCCSFFTGARSQNVWMMSQHVPKGKTSKSLKILVEYMILIYSVNINLVMTLNLVSTIM